MLPEIEIETLLIVESGDAAESNTKTEALAQLLEKDCQEIKRSGNSLRFKVEWEPPWKTLKTWSKENPETKITLWGDAFKKHHWLLKATIEDGKQQEQTLSRIDDEFDAIFKEVYDCTFEEWEKQARKPFTAMP